MKPPVDWMLSGEPWIEYQTRVTLLNEPLQNPKVTASRDAMLADSRIARIISDLQDWPGKVISSHKSASQPFHRLNFLADIGIDQIDPGMQPIIDKILALQSEEGPFQLPMNIPSQYGGSGKEEGAWALCDAPLIVYALIKLGLSNDPGVTKAVEYLLTLQRENGWPCAVSKALGSWRGPGRKDDPCPYANLAMLKVLAVLNDPQYEPISRIGVESLLHAWENRQNYHPYMFYMGTDFSKLKLPFIWYDLMQVLDVLTSFDWTRSDPRILEMVEILRSKMDLEGKFTPESVWTAWSDWEFGQKKEPSRWLTLSAWRILERVNTIH